MPRITKTKIGIGSVSLAIILATAITAGITRYSCGLHYRCMATAYHIQVMYPYSWQTSSYHLESSVAGKNGLVIVDPDRNTVVGLRPEYVVPKQNNLPGEQVNDSYKAVKSQLVASLPDVLDVQLIDKTDTVEFGRTVAESYTPVESIMAKVQYRQLGLTTNSYRLLSESQQEFLFQPPGLGVGLLLMAVDQKQSNTEQSAKAWFSQRSAQEAHAILLSVRQKT